MSAPQLDPAEVVARLRKWSEAREEARNWGGPTMEPAFPLSHTEIVAMAAAWSRCTCRPPGGPSLRAPVSRERGA